MNTPILSVPRVHVTIFDAAQSEYVVKEMTHREMEDRVRSAAPGRARVKRQKAGTSEAAVQLQEVESIAERLRELFSPGTCITFKNGMARKLEPEEQEEAETPSSVVD